MKQSLVSAASFVVAYLVAFLVGGIVGAIVLILMVLMGDAGLILAAGLIAASLVLVAVVGRIQTKRKRAASAGDAELLTIARRVDVVTEPKAGRR